MNLERINEDNIMTDPELNQELSKLFDMSTLIAKKRSLFVLNDDKNSFDHVIDCLMLFCGHTFEQASQCAQIIHNNGKCEVKKGYFENILIPMTFLEKNGLKVQIK